VEPNSIYYLPGAGGRLETGLGAGLASRGLTVFGRATVGAFKELPFDEQVRAIADDLCRYCWRPDGRVIANSFGAYLFLQAQAQLPSYPGRVLLLSPILGNFANEQTGHYFSPPKATHLMRIAREGLFPFLTRGEIHVGDQDWQSPTEIVQEFGVLVQIPVKIAKGRGHQLGADYVSQVLGRWL
jgi:hypothetical protein